MSSYQRSRFSVVRVLLRIIIRHIRPRYANRYIRILCVAAYRSNHADRHVELLARHGYDLHFAVLDDGFTERAPLAAGVNVHERIKSPPNSSSGIPNVPDDASGADLLHLANRALPSKGADTAAVWLAALIDELRPDVMHSFAIHQASFLTLIAREHAQYWPFWIVSNWGCDIHHFGQDPRLRDAYLPAIRATLSQADGYFAETRRDVALAHGAGFTRAVLAVAPIGGGFDIDRFRALRDGQAPSRRNIIMVKGYEGNSTGLSVGRASMAVEALALAARHLNGYEVNFYAAYEPEILEGAARLRDEHGLNVRVHPFMPYDELMRLHGRARCSIGISETDGIATSAIEAMLMGSVPIQSDTSGLGEWVDPNGALLVPYDQPEAIAAALIRAVSDDAFVDAAALSNDATLTARFSMAAVDPVIVQMYQTAFSLKRRALKRRIAGGRPDPSGS